MSSRRYTDIDIARAIAMLAVFWGHVMLGGITNSVCYAFHIPFFFFLSGLMFDPRRYPDFSCFLKKRVQSLLVPYVFYSAVTWLWWVVRAKLLCLPLQNPLDSLLQTLIAQGSGGFLRHNVALWFVTALFVVEMAWFFIRKLPGKWPVPVLVLCGVLGYVLVQPNSFFDFKRLPWNLEAALTGIVFYGAGSLARSSRLPDRFRQFVSASRKKAWLLTGLLLAALIAGARANGHATVAQGSFGRNVFLFYINSADAIPAVLLLSILLNGSRLPAPLRKWMLWFGRRSFRAMAIHVPVMVDLVYVTSRLFHADIQHLRYQYRYTVPIFLGMLIITGLWMYLLEKAEKKLRK